MAYNVTALPAYVNEQNLELIQDVYFSSKSFDLFDKQTGILSSADLHTLNQSTPFQDGSTCGHNPLGTTTIGKRNIVVGKIKVDLEWCTKDLEPKVTQHALKCARYPDTLPFEAEIMSETNASIAAQIEKALWQGDLESGDVNLNKFDGWIKTVSEGGGGYVSGGTGVLNAGNIIAAVNAVYAAIPIEILDKEDTAIYLGSDYYRLYVAALTAANQYHYIADESAVKSREMILPGTATKVIALNGLNGSHAIFAGQRSNFVIGTACVDDAEQYELWFSQDDRTFKFQSLFYLGTQVRQPKYIVYFQYS